MDGDRLTFSILNTPFSVWIRGMDPNWGGEGSNLRSPKATDLQSVPFVRLGTSPCSAPTIYDLPFTPPT
jgi:hypothetical protein